MYFSEFLWIQIQASCCTVFSDLPTSPIPPFPYKLGEFPPNDINTLKLEATSKLVKHLGQQYFFNNMFGKN